MIGPNVKDMKISLDKKWLTGTREKKSVSISTVVPPAAELTYEHCSRSEPIQAPFINSFYLIHSHFVSS